MKAATVEAELRLEPPESVAFGEEVVRVGGTVYRGLKHLMAHQSGATLTSFCKAVWGKDALNDTVRSLIFRVNSLLKGLRCERRLVLVGDRVEWE